MLPATCRQNHAGNHAGVTWTKAVQVKKYFSPYFWEESPPQASVNPRFIRGCPRPAGACPAAIAVNPRAIAVCPPAIGVNTAAAKVCPPATGVTTPAALVCPRMIAACPPATWGHTEAASGESKTSKIQQNEDMRLETPHAVSCDLRPSSPRPSPPRRGRIVCSVFGMWCDRVCRMMFRE
jgi:hypothetical protein